MTTTKKILITIFVLAVLGAGVYWFVMNRGGEGGEATNAQGFSIRNFFPFGNSENVTFPENTNVQNDNQNELGNEIENGFENIGAVPKFRKISQQPIAGAVIFRTGTTSIVRYVEKATGNVYEIQEDQVRSVRLTNDTIPRIYKALWLSDGSGFIAQTIDSNETVLTSFVRLRARTGATTEVTLYETVISNLPTGITGITTSPDGKKIFYLVKGGVGIQGFVSNPDGTGPTQVFSHFLTEWVPQWYSANSILLSQKASRNTSSYGFTLNPSTKAVTQSYGPISGVSALAGTNGDLLLGDGTSLFFKERATSTPINLDISTLPEKCTWDQVDSKFIYCGIPLELTGNYPNDWYRGTATTNDLIQKINVFDLYTFILINPEEQGISFDVSTIQASRDGGILIATNKHDQSLWLLLIQ